MTRIKLTAECLLAAGFVEVGCWELNSARELAHRIKVPAVSGVYAFAINGIVQYVGLASKSLRQRLGFYRKPGTSQRTNIRLNEIIRANLGSGLKVEILLAQPPDSEWNGLKIRGAEGLEAGLIAEFDLPWNVRGSYENRSSQSPSSGTTVTGAAMQYFVYENWTRDKAIVHREDCSFCKSGQGLHGTGPTRNSRWHGPFASSAAAIARAKSCGRARTEGCAVCSPM